MTTANRPAGATVAVVTGAARGFGDEIARRLVTRGPRVLITDLDAAAVIASRRAGLDLLAACAPMPWAPSQALVASSCRLAPAQRMGPIDGWQVRGQAGACPSGDPQEDRP